MPHCYGSGLFDPTVYTVMSRVSSPLEWPLTPKFDRATQAFLKNRHATRSLVT